MEILVPSFAGCVLSVLLFTGVSGRGFQRKALVPFLGGGVMALVSVGGTFVIGGLIYLEALARGGSL